MKKHFAFACTILVPSLFGMQENLIEFAHFFTPDIYRVCKRAMIPGPERKELERCQGLTRAFNYAAAGTAKGWHPVTLAPTDPERPEYVCTTIEKIADSQEWDSETKTREIDGMLDIRQRLRSDTVGKRVTNLSMLLQEHCESSTQNNLPVARTLKNLMYDLTKSSDTYAEFKKRNK